MRDFFARHSRVALMFSGGRDSIACLKLCAEFLPQITVVWVNPGNPYPETVEQMRKVREGVPHFEVVMGQQPEFIRKNGYPLDLVPIGMTALGRTFRRVDGISAVSFIDCCATNMWQPAAEHIASAGYTGVIRGDKRADELKPPLDSGDTRGGVEFLFPLESWTEDDVTRFVGGELPASYRRGVRTSLDCMNCTAYLSHNAERIRDLATVDPEAHAEVRAVLRSAAEEIERHRGEILETGVGL